MANKATAHDLFLKWAESAADEVTKRGLGDMFDEAVKALVEENPGTTPEELTVLFDKCMTELEQHVDARIKEHFGEKATLGKVHPAFRQYKSDYRGLIKLIGTGVAQHNGPYKVKMKKIELSKGSAGDGKTPADNGAAGNGAGSKGGEEGTGAPTKAPAVNDPGLPEAVRKYLDNGVKALMQMDPAEAEEVARKFHDAAFMRLKRGSKKMGVTGGAAA